MCTLPFLMKLTKIQQHTPHYFAASEGHIAVRKLLENDKRLNKE